MKHALSLGVIALSTFAVPALADVDNEIVTHLKVATELQLERAAGVARAKAQMSQMGKGKQKVQFTADEQCGMNLTSAYILAMADYVERAKAKGPSEKLAEVVLYLDDAQNNGKTTALALKQVRARSAQGKAPAVHLEAVPSTGELSYEISVRGLSNASWVAPHTTDDDPAKWTLEVWTPACTYHFYLKKPMVGIAYANPLTALKK